MYDFEFNESVTRHINFIINECQNTQDKGVLATELENYPFEFRSYNRKEDITKSIHFNLEKYITYLKDNHIAEYRIANDEQGYPDLVDIPMEDGETLEIPAMYAVRVFDFKRLEKLCIAKTLDNVKQNRKHLQGKIIHIEKGVAYYGPLSTRKEEKSYPIKFKRKTITGYLFDSLLLSARTVPCNLTYENIWNASELNKKIGVYNNGTHAISVYNAFRTIIIKLNGLIDNPDAQLNIPKGFTVKINQHQKMQMVEFSNPKIHKA